MAVLIFATWLLIPHAHAGAFERFEKRASGYEAYIHELDELEAERLSAAHAQHERRERAREKYEHARDTYQRPPLERDPAVEAAYRQKMAAREAEEARKQEIFAEKHRRELQAIDREAARLKPREYDLNGGRP